MTGKDDRSDTIPCDEHVKSLPRDLTFSSSPVLVSGEAAERGGGEVVRTRSEEQNVETIEPQYWLTYSLIYSLNFIFRVSQEARSGPLHFPRQPHLNSHFGGEVVGLADTRCERDEGAIVWRWNNGPYGGNGVSLKLAASKRQTTLSPTSRDDSYHSKGHPVGSGAGDDGREGEKGWDVCVEGPTTRRTDTSSPILVKRLRTPLVQCTGRETMSPSFPSLPLTLV